MILDTWHKDAFRDYAKPLEKLEKSFNKAGLPIKFHAFVAPREIKMVRVTGGNSPQKLICIEGGSPAQAVKDVAAGVRL
jgi:hypothetical protein